MGKRPLNITRRDFMRGTVGAAIGVSVARRSQAASPRAARSARVVLVRDERALDARHAVNAAVLARMLGDLVQRVTQKATAAEAWRSLVKPSDIVGLVSTPHMNPTHPELVDAVCAAVAQGGPDAVRPCTVLISLPALKAHWLTGIGTVIKNYVMFSGAPSHYHHADSAKLGEIWKLPIVEGKTRLVVVDALRGLCDKGPQPDPRYRWDYRGLVGGIDPVAVETVCLKILTEKRKALRGEPWPLSPPPLCVTAADETYGLGTSRWSEITLDRVGWAEDALV